MRMRRWTASVRAREHMLEKHNVEWHEVEEVMQKSPQIRRGRRVRGEQRYYVHGRTRAGRRLTVVFAVRGDTGAVVTAYQRQ